MAHTLHIFPRVATSHAQNVCDMQLMTIAVVTRPHSCHNAMKMGKGTRDVAADAWGRGRSSQSEVDDKHVMHPLPLQFLLVLLVGAYKSG